MATPKKYLQELVWMPKSTLPEPRMNCSVPFTGSKRPDRLWTLYLHTDKNQPPSLPFKPIHNENAFIEDYMHDWDISNGKLKYFSRVCFGGVWLLLEFASVDND